MTVSTIDRPLLEARAIVVEYPGRSRRAGPKRVLHGVDLVVMAGETVGLVGESGSGKTTLGRAILGLVKPITGSIRFDGEEIVGADRRRRRELSRDIQVIFQDPYSSLNPSMTVEEILVEPLMVHGMASRQDARAKARRLVDRVSLPADTLRRLPREFSGGQRQRIAIARSLMVDPRLIVCDEPVSALDVSTQDRVVRLLREIQEETGVAYVFIAHDLVLVRQLSDSVAVMYRGGIVESGNSEVIGDSPRHPYTQRLLLAAPVPDPRSQRARRSERLALIEDGSTEALSVVR